METPTVTEVVNVQKENELIKTLFVKTEMKPRPGQFIMVWLPGQNEKPYAASYLDKGKLGITVMPVGPFSKKLCELKVGDKIGLRGPYGKGYGLLDGPKNIVIASGGVGAASVATLAEEAAKLGIRIKYILGSKTKSALIFPERIKKLLANNLIITTDDGSAGEKGFVTDALKKILNTEKIDKIFACGPERMLKAVVDLGLKEKVPGEINMERYMKCGFGVCGHCCLDPIGIRLCVEGPVIDFPTASKISEFGNYFRTKSSRKEKM
jgi:dihydroorotate dehydrogenase electron transfer subunit